jgi:hypothetical protein
MRPVPVPAVLLLLFPLAVLCAAPVAGVVTARRPQCGLAARWVASTRCGRRQLTGMLPGGRQRPAPPGTAVAQSHRGGSSGNAQGTARLVACRWGPEAFVRDRPHAAANCAASRDAPRRAATRYTAAQRVTPRPPHAARLAGRSQGFPPRASLLLPMMRGDGSFAAMASAFLPGWARRSGTSREPGPEKPVRQMVIPSEGAQRLSRRATSMRGSRSWTFYVARCSDDSFYPSRTCFATMMADIALGQPA